MGNIRQNNIKNITSRLLANHENVFTSNFDANKRLVAKYTTIESKVIRNRVAGYVTRRINHKRHE
ncbi:30S ribosomal protein S17e [Methanohalophilus sp. RSK]|uniref:30S ribosomal protein S17e n=1 Tax=Methanohalophilus sp. RSK TaxID=2485783 RepID=UPI000F43B17E|nr:30S ribosomal protein S17e [Methanohalophilus sp. RSK]RNI14389.1 30S ribosomal protein S17e [Methanohalophilus sp. RSK]